jgi:dTDP-4-amino-4,6-dideoxygalactose transaminase
MIVDKLSTTKLVFPTWPVFTEDEILKVSDVLSSGKVNYWTGQEGQLFEEEYAKAVGTNYAVALMNGTVALEAALAALDIGPGDEVITTSRTFMASASCIVMRGATPVLADVDTVSQNVTVETMQSVLTSKTKAIIVVHLAGWPCDMQAIMQFAKDHQLFVIEDCAQAHGATYLGRPVGSWGDISAFSFCQDKIITTGGEGGMITTNNKTWWEKIWALKDHGKSHQAVFGRVHPPGFRWLHESFGTNWRMTEMQAAIGRIQLNKLPTWTMLRQRNAAILMNAFKTIPAFCVAAFPNTIQHACYKYYTFVTPELLKPDWNRDRILKAIMDAGVPCFSGSCSEIYLEKAFIDKQLGPKTRFPNAKQLGERSLMFLVHPTLTEEHMQHTANVVHKIMHLAML